MLRDDIKAFVTAQPAAPMPVPTPELPQWDGQIFVARISARRIAGLSQAVDGEDIDQNDERAAFVVECATDSAGSRIFQAEDVAWLSTCQQLSPMVERLYWAAQMKTASLTKTARAGEKTCPPRPPLVRLPPLPHLRNRIRPRRRPALKRSCPSSCWTSGGSYTTWSRGTRSGRTWPPACR